MPLPTFLRPRERALRARVHTDGCRGYVVELEPAAEGAGAFLTDRRGGAVHFRSLDRVRAALRRRGVVHAVLVQRHACEEATASGACAVRERGTVILREGRGPHRDAGAARR